MPRKMLHLKEPNTLDSRGTVTVKFIRTEKGSAVRGNIIRSLTLQDTTVSEAFEGVRALLEKKR